LARISQYLKSVPKKATVRGALYQAVADQPLVGAAEWVEALMLLMYNPGTIVAGGGIKNGFSSVFASCDIQQLSSKLASPALQCAKLMREARATLESHDVADRIVTVAVGDFGRNLAAHVHSKSKQFLDIQAVQWNFWSNLEATLGAEKFAELKPPRTWGKTPKAAKAVAETVSNMQTLTAVGATDTAAQLVRLGFNVGEIVTEKSDKATDTDKNNKATDFEIRKISKTIVELKRAGALDDDDNVSVDHGAFAVKYKLKKVVKHDSRSIGDVCASSAWSHEKHAAMAKLILGQVWTECFDRVKNRVKVVLKPSRKVVVLEDFAKGELVLVPLSPMVRFVSGAVDATKLTPVVFSQLSFEADGKTFVCTINGKPATEHDKDYVPFFFVSSSMEQSESNVSSTLYPCVAFGEDYNVPVLVNHKLIKAGDEVKMYFKTVNAKPNTIVAFPHQQTRGEAASDTQGALPKKKARKT